MFTHRSTLPLNHRNKVIIKVDSFRFFCFFFSDSSVVCPRSDRKYQTNLVVLNAVSLL